jgi:hypothetical protein
VNDGRLAPVPPTEGGTVAVGSMLMCLLLVGQRLGSGDGERKTLLTRQIAFEPLPASVLFALVLAVVVIMVWTLGGGNM